MSHACSVGVTHLCTVISQPLRWCLISVQIIVKDEISSPHINYSAIYHNRKTSEKQKALSSALSEVETRGEGEKKWESLLFQTYQFHVNGRWNAKILAWPFPTRFRPFSLSPFSPYFFHNSLPSRIWFLDMICQITCGISYATGDGIVSL